MPDPNLLTERALDTVADDLGRDLHAEHRRLDLGPVHPLTSGALELRVELDGETIVGLEPQVGYLHRGFEKECESRGWDQAVPYVDRLAEGAAMFPATAFCMAVEALLELEVPVRGQWLRVLACELARVSDHLGRCARLCLHLEATTAAQYALAAREWVWELMEALSGARVTSGYVCIGGVRTDLPEDFDEHLRSVIQEVRERLRDFDGMVTQNRVFVDRLKGTGILSADDCIRYAVTGPVLRAAGVALDLRKAQPYLTYDELEFSVIVGEVGDNYDRHLVCVEETRQSLALVEQCVERLGALAPGPVRCGESLVRWNPAPEGEAPAWRHGAEPADETSGLCVPAGERYVAVESANGELGFYLVSDGSKTPCKVRCRPPSFLNVQPLEQMVRGALLSDLVPTLDLVNPIGAECDR